MRKLLSAVPLAFNSFPALAHQSGVDHAHPHEHVMDNALLGYETLGLAALALAVCAGAGLLLARRKK